MSKSLTLFWFRHTIYSNVSHQMMMPFFVVVWHIISILSSDCSKDNTWRCKVATFFFIYLQHHFWCHYNQLFICHKFCCAWDCDLKRSFCGAHYHLLSSASYTYIFFFFFPAYMSSVFITDSCECVLIRGKNMQLYTIHFMQTPPYKCHKLAHNLDQPFYYMKYACQHHHFYLFAILFSHLA